MKTLTRLIVITLSIVALAAWSAWAGELTIPNTFTAGTTAVASEVNDNFSAVETEVVDNALDITANTGNIATNASAIATKQNRVTGTCAAGSSIRAIAADGTVTCETDNDSGGDITAVTAGSYLSGGGTSGPVTLNVSGMPGVDFIEGTDGEYTKYPAQTDITVLSQTITAPTAGYVMAIYGGVGYFIHTAGTYQRMRFWINTNGGDQDAGSSFRFLDVIASAISGGYYHPVSSFLVLAVPAGSTTFYVRADGFQADGETNVVLYKNSLSLLFFPVRY